MALMHVIRNEHVTCVPEHNGSRINKPGSAARNTNCPFYIQDIKQRDCNDSESKFERSGKFNGYSVSYLRVRSMTIICLTICVRKIAPDFMCMKFR